MPLSVEYTRRGSSDDILHAMAALCHRLGAEWEVSFNAVKRAHSQSITSALDIGRGELYDSE